jgi:hypothetical protein
VRLFIDEFRIHLQLVALSFLLFLQVDRYFSIHSLAMNMADNFPTTLLKVKEMIAQTIKHVRTITHSLHCITLSIKMIIEGKSTGPCLSGLVDVDLAIRSKITEDTSTNVLRRFTISFSSPLFVVSALKAMINELMAFVKVCAPLECAVNYLAFILTRHQVENRYLRDQVCIELLSKLKM